MAPARDSCDEFGVRDLGRARIRRACVALCALLALACGEKDDGGPTPPVPIPIGPMTKPLPTPDGGGGTSSGHPSPTGTGGDPRPDAAPIASDAATPSASVTCAPRSVEGDARIHFHHVHFNTTDADADLDFFERFLDASPIDFCKDAASGAVTRATKTERGYFLFTEVPTAPDPALNTYLEHVGWIHPSPTEELLRLVDLGAPLFPEGRAQCAEAFAGQSACGLGGYWFYLQAPSGARIEVARGPGPATAGFGHVHMIMGVDFAWFGTVTDGAYQDGAIDLVNHTSVSLVESILATETVVETRGKPIDHLGYSTTDLEAARDRIVAAGIAIEDDIAFRPEFGFRSFFVKDAKGIWVEIVEDSPFSP